jgi:hypothetical protein
MDQTLSRSNRQHALGTVGFARAWFRETSPWGDPTTGQPINVTKINFSSGRILAGRFIGTDQRRR